MKWLTLLLALAFAVPGAAAKDDPYRKLRLESGLYLPYPLDNLFRGWMDCTRRGHHRALDIGGVGPNFGLGTPIRAMTRSKVVRIGLPQEEPERFGDPLMGTDETERGGKRLPTSMVLPEYGRVYFFTRNYGRHRSGALITLQALDGPLKDHTFDYMHIAAVHPKLKVGDIVEGGQEIAVMGGTAVQIDGPHLHLAIYTPKGQPLDVGTIFGIGPTRVPCGSGDVRRLSIRGQYSQVARKLMASLRSLKPEPEDTDLATAKPKEGPSCGEQIIKGTFKSLKTQSFSYLLAPLKGANGELVPTRIRMRRLDNGKWSPRIQLKTTANQSLFTGTKAANRTSRIATFKALASGKKGEAEVIFHPKTDATFVIEATHWITNPRALRKAEYELVIDRLCPGAQ